MDTVTIDWLLVFIATVMNLCMKNIWFSKWMFGSCFSNKNFCHDSLIRSPFIRLFMDFLMSFVIAYAFALLQSLLVITSITDALILAWIVWLAFLLPVFFDDWIWQEKKGDRILIQAAFKCISLSVISAIIGA